MQALIYSVLISVFVSVLRRALIWAGDGWSWAEWTSGVQLGWSVALALLLGLILSAAANSNVPHRFLIENRLLRKLGVRVTNRTAFPSEWYRAFSENPTYVVLTLPGERRLRGYPFEYPDTPTSGHFVLQDA